MKKMRLPSPIKKAITGPVLVQVLLVLRLLRPRQVVAQLLQAVAALVAAVIAAIVAAVARGVADGARVEETVLSRSLGIHKLREKTMKVLLVLKRRKTMSLSRM